MITEGSLPAIFHHLAEFLRKAGELGIFDTLVHNYRLKESFSLSHQCLENFTKDLRFLITTIQKYLLNSSDKQSKLIVQSSSSLVDHANTITAEDKNISGLEGLAQPVENSIEINITRKKQIQSRAKSNNAPRIENQITNSRAYSCDFCVFRNVAPLPGFDSLSQLNQHKRQDHPNVKCFFCSMCDLSFQSNQSLRKHQRLRHSEQAFSCSLCPAVFEQNVQLTTHKLENHPEPAQPCSHCDFVCFSNKSLRAHLAKNHSGDGAGSLVRKIFSCTFCSKQFPRKDKWEFHLRTHTGQKPFICASCGKGFSRKFKLDDHEARHLGVKKYVCAESGCGKAYASNVDLKIHVSKLHIENGPTVVAPTRKKRFRKRPSKRVENPTVPNLAYEVFDNVGDVSVLTTNYELSDAQYTALLEPPPAIPHFETYYNDYPHQEIDDAGGVRPELYYPAPICVDAQGTFLNNVLEPNAESNCTFDFNASYINPSEVNYVVDENSAHVLPLSQGDMSAQYYDQATPNISSHCDHNMYF